MIIRIFLFFFFLLPVTVAGAQTLKGYHIERYGTEDGLPSNGIKGLQWDKKTRFLWIATEAGMVRYNGMSFKTYTNEDNPSITNERILFLVRNNAGKIFTADNMGNIFSVNKNSLDFIKKVPIAGNAASNIVTISVSEALYGGNHSFNSGPFALQFDKVLPINDTACFIVHTNRLFYFTLSMKTPQLLTTPVQNIISSFKCSGEVFVIDKNNNCWLLDKTTLLPVKINFTFETSLLKPNIKTSLLLWDNGLDFPILINKERAFKIDFINNRLRASLICDRVPQDALIRFVQYDESIKTLFLGTDSKGIVVIKENLVEQLRKTRTSANERASYYSQVELPDGSIMTNEGHILGKSKPATATIPFKNPFSISTYMMGDSVFWFMQLNPSLHITCLHSYNFKNRKLTVYDKIRQNFSQLVMAESGGSLYLADETGIYCLQRDSLAKVFTYQAFDKLRTHFSMIETGPGILVIANCYSLLQFDIKTKKLDTLYSEGNYCVRTLWRYKDYVFFGTYGNGLYVIKNGKVKPLPLDKNRYLLFTHCFVDDGLGYCWISTNRGLFKASIEELVNAYEQEAPMVYYHYFGRNDGMMMTEMNGGCAPCALVMKNKTISFPTMEGVLWVNPKTAIPMLPDGELFIDEILVDNKRTSPKQLKNVLQVPFRHDIHFRLGFSAWCNKENIYIEYKLSTDKEWRVAHNDNSTAIQFSNLASGNYTLYIRKLNGFGVNNYSYKEFRFTVPTPWHQQWWFYLLSLLAALGLVLLYLGYRTRRYRMQQLKLEEQVTEKTKELQQQNEVLEKNNTIKTRLISIISHDIVTPLKFLTVAGKNLLEKRKMMPEDLQQETIQEITNTSQELQLLSTNILNWIKYQNENRRLTKETFNLNEMVGQVFGILQSLAKQKNLSLENNIDAGLEVHQYYEPLKILVYNLLTNAIHFTEKGAVIVSSARTGNLVTLLVKDEGIGMSAEQVQRLMEEHVVITSANVDIRKGHGLGYLIIKDLLKTMNATMKIDSKKGIGTTVAITMEG